MTLSLFSKSAPRAGARFSPCRTWRYEFWRCWSDDTRSVAVFCGVNPSTADETREDPTCRRDIAFAKRMGHGRMIKVNLFAYAGPRSTEPLSLLDEPDPVGPENDMALLSAAKATGATFIACWGSHRKSKALTDLVRRRALRVTEMLLDHGIAMFCFGRNGDGMPKHTLYLPSTTALSVFEGAQETGT